MAHKRNMMKPRDLVTFFYETFAANSASVLLREIRTGRDITYGEAMDASRRFATFFVRQGCRKDAPVAFAMDNCAELALCYFACMHLGVPFFPVNPALPDDEIRKLLDLSGVETMVVSPTILSRRQNVVAGIKNPICIKPETDAEQSPIHAYAADDIFADNSPVALTGDIADSHPALFIPTSGTSGAPKILELDWRSLIGNGRVFSECMGISRNHRFYNILPMSYLGGIYNLLLIPAINGASLAVNASFGGGVMYSFWDDVRDHGINTLWFTATMLTMLLDIDDGSDVDFLKRQIRLGLVGMAPLAPATKERFESRFHFKLYENFALSETLFLTSERPGRPRKAGGSGTALPGVTIAIVDGDGAPVPAGRDGEIRIRSPFRMRGYRAAGAEDQERLLPEGGMLTGDIGHVDEDGELFVTGRSKDLIIRGGVNVSPRQIEDVLLAHPAVAAVAVVGVPSAVYGEDVAAAVVLSAGTPNSQIEHELIDYCAARLAWHQCPHAVKILDALPAGATGKILKREIRALFTKAT